MQIILLDHIDKVGDKHDVVTVKDGFGRNYLIPKGLAIVANKPNMARLDGLKKVAEKKESALLGTYQGYVSQIAGKKLTVTMKAGDSGRLFGSVNAQAIADQLVAMGIPVEKRNIQMPEDVKELGSYEANLKFHPKVQTTVAFEVVAEQAQ
jgi:large subunit ribosomal protein L9